MGNSLNRIYAFVFASAMLWAIVFFLMPIYLKDIGMSGLEIGILSGITAIAALLSLFPVGYINDRWSTRGVLIVSFILVSVFFLGVGFLEGFWIFLPLYILGGIFSQAYRSTLRNLVYKKETDARDGEKFGNYNMFMIYGKMVGLILIALLFVVVDFPTVLKITAVAFALLALAALLLKPAKIALVKMGDYKADFMRKDVIFFSIIVFLFTLHWGAESTSYGLFVKTNLGLDLTMSSLFMALPLLFLGYASIKYGKRIDRGKNLGKMLAIGAVFSGLTHILMAYPLVEWSFLMRCVHEFADGIFNVALLFQIGKFFPKERIGGNVGLMVMVMAVGEFAAAMVFGWMGPLYGYEWPLIISGIISIVVAGIYWVYWKGG